LESSASVLFGNINIGDITLETPDHVKLKGYFIHNSTASKSPLLIYYGGNNEPIALAKREDVDSGQIVMMGRSLGTGGAVYVAKERSVQGVVLISPYDSIKGVQEDQVPFLPAALIKNDFNSVELAKSIHAPVLCFIGDKDHFISPQRSKTLIKAWAGESNIRTIQGANHQDISFSHFIYDDTVEFLSKIHSVTPGQFRDSQQ
jgi:predicted alpha/beta hydrolase family esterase